jgi:hypothetical protein
MKKISVIKKYFTIWTIMIFLGCTKSIEMSNAVINNKYALSEIVATEAFVTLNNAIVRFDPLYLQVMYKEKRNRAEIQKLSTALIIEINKNPNNIAAQKALTVLYHFESFNELQKASEAISNNAKKFNESYFNTSQNPTVEQKNFLTEERNRFIKNKITLLDEASQKRTTGLWNDMVDDILRELHYWTLVRNEEFENEDSGAGSECKDACCYEYKACLTKAASSYRLNFLTLGTALAAGGGGLGALYGSVVPILGTVAIGTGGGIIGGVSGFIQAVNIYMKDQEACVYSYKACTIRQNQK